MEEQQEQQMAAEGLTGRAQRSGRPGSGLPTSKGCWEFQSFCHPFHLLHPEKDLHPSERKTSILPQPALEGRTVVLGPYVAMHWDVVKLQATAAAQGP